MVARPTAGRLAAATLAGLLLTVSFEPYGVAWLLPVAVALAAAAARGAGHRLALIVGAVLGATFMLGLLPWLRVIGTDAWIMLSLFEGAFYGLLGLGTAVVGRRRAWPVWVATLWVAVEALRSLLPFGGFPWGRLAFATAEHPFASWMPLAGSAGVTFLVALSGTLLLWAAERVRRTPKAAAAGVLAAGLLTASGALLPDGWAPGTRQTGNVRVAAVQGNVPGVGMDAFTERRAVLDNHVQATRDLAARVASGVVPPPDLVVWPENSSDIDPYLDRTVRADISAVVAEVGAPTLVGAMVSGPGPMDVENRGIVWDPLTGPGQHYAKTHPVPFGEYIPFRSALARWFERLDQIPRDMVPGGSPGLLQMGDTLIGDLICFEVAYDGLLRDLVRGGAEIVVVQTNNATYIESGQVEQQFAISRLRARESGRHVVVAATNGISGIVAPDGNAVQRTAPRTQEVLLADVPTTTGVTPAVRFGALVEMALAVLGGIVVLLGLTGVRTRSRPAVARERVTADNRGER